MTTKLVNVKHTITGIEETVPETTFNHPVLGQFLEEIDYDPNCIDCGVQDETPETEPEEVETEPEEVEPEVVYFDEDEEN